LLGVPIVCGALTGILLGVSSTAYGIAFMASLMLCLRGAYEHVGRLEGTLRGIIFGTLFGIFLLAAHSVAGSDATAELPHPEVAMILLTAGMGGVGGEGMDRIRRFVERIRELRAERARRRTEERAVEESG